jgi:hypothetical protein
MIILFRESAFKHGFDRDDYDQVMRNCHLLLRSRRGIDDVYEVLGRNEAGDLLRVITRDGREGEERIIIVFHMTRMDDADRRRFLRMERK